MSKDPLKARLEKRREENSYRALPLKDNDLVDFCSNDYLGLAKSPQLKKSVIEQYSRLSGSLNGATGSRLITGSSQQVVETESFLTAIFETDSGLLFSSGYMANLAFFSSVLQKGDTLLYDELAHACIKDGARLSPASRFPFRHNDLEHLESKLKKAKGQAYIACESVYSMDGDFAPLEALTELAKKYKARLVVDEAHSTGVFGKNGNGLVNELGLNKEVFATIYTFGKALGIHGGFVAGSELLREYLINFARPFIYTTAPSDFEALSVVVAFQFLQDHQHLASDLHARIKVFRQLANSSRALIDSHSAIQALIIPGNDEVKAVSLHLKAHGFDVRPILSPTVQAGNERLRLCLHSFNTEKEVADMVLCLNDYLS